MPERQFVVVYLAHPFTGDPKGNLARVNCIARAIIDCCQHSSRIYLPLVPHLALSVYDEESKPTLRAATEALSCRLARASDELWVVSPRISKGMHLEIRTARASGLRVRQWHQVLRLVPELKHIAAPILGPTRPADPLSRHPRRRSTAPRHQ